MKAFVLFVVALLAFTAPAAACDFSCAEFGVTTLSVPVSAPVYFQSFGYTAAPVPVAAFGVPVPVYATTFSGLDVHAPVVLKDVRIRRGFFGLGLFGRRRAVVRTRVLVH